MKAETLVDSATHSLRRELRSVAREAEALLKATSEVTDDAVQEARDRATNTLRRAYKLMGNGRTTEYAREAAYQARRYVRKHPWGTVGAVATLAGVSILLGCLTRRR